MFLSIRYHKICLITASLFSILPAKAQLLQHIESLSRDHFYIHLSSSKPLYAKQSFIGGEHQHHYLLLGFEGDKFEILINSDDQHVGYIMPDEAYLVESQKWNEKTNTVNIKIKVLERQSWIEVVFSTYPSAAYHVQFTKISR